VGGDDAEFDAGFDLDGGRHNGVSWGLIELERDAGHPSRKGFAAGRRFQLKCLRIG
jgi:hypothetical protein